MDTKKKVFDVYWATISFTGGTCPLFTSGKCYASTSKCQKAPKLYDLIKKLKNGMKSKVFFHILNVLETCTCAITL